jgi:hypothetical protein
METELVYEQDIVFDENSYDASDDVSVAVESELTFEDYQILVEADVYGLMYQAAFTGFGVAGCLMLLGLGVAVILSILKRA